MQKKKTDQTALTLVIASIMTIITNKKKKKTRQSLISSAHTYPSVIDIESVVVVVVGVLVTWL